MVNMHILSWLTITNSSAKIYIDKGVDYVV